MSREEIFEAIEKERAYQDEKWGRAFDDRNTPNDWVSYVAKYLGQSVTMPFDRSRFHEQLLKAATLCVAALERDEFPPRHYDK